MTISISDITNYFGLSNTDNLQLFVRWVLLSPNQKFPQKSEQTCAPNGFQLDVGQFAYMTLKTESDKRVFSAYIFADSTISFRRTNYPRISLTHYLMYGKSCKDKISDVFQAYRKADETVSMEESLPRQQRLANLAKRSGGEWNKFLGLAKSHELINGFDKKQVAEIRNFWDSWILSQQTRQAPQAASPAQSPFAVKQSAQTVPGPLQSPFVAQQPVQAPTTPPMAPQTQAPQVSLQGIYNLLQQLFPAI